MNSLHRKKKRNVAVPLCSGPRRSRNGITWRDSGPPRDYLFPLVLALLPVFLLLVSVGAILFVLSLSQNLPASVKRKIAKESGPNLSFQVSRMKSKGNLDNFVVGTVPTVMYIPDFITDSEETQLLDKVYTSPVSKWKSLKNRRLQNWGGIVHEKGLLPQELPLWLKKVTEKVYEELGLFPSAINHVLINEYLPDQGIMPHQDGPAYHPVVAILSLGSAAIMDFVPHPSLRSSPNTSGSDREDSELNGAPDSGTNKWLNNHHPFSVVLMPRSLLIFKDDTYSSYLHGIRDSSIHRYEGAVNEAEAVGCQPLLVSEEGDEAVRNGDGRCIHRTGTRISLTCRLVSKVHHKLFKF